MNEDRGHGALPKLYGAPAYSRPPVKPAKPVERPFDPDDLPLEAERVDEPDGGPPDLRPRPYDSVATSGPHPPTHDAKRTLRGRAFRIRIPGIGR